MPNIPPLITTMPDNQSLYAPYVGTEPATQQYQNFSCNPVACNGSGTLPPAAEVILFTAPVPYDFGTQTFTRLFFADAGFSYTAASTTGTIVFRLKVDGISVQSISQTPSLSPQSVAFNQFSTIFPATTGSGSYLLTVTAQSTDANTITATNTQFLYGAVLGCKAP